MPLLKWLICSSIATAATAPSQPGARQKRADHCRTERARGREWDGKGVDGWGAFIGAGLFFLVGGPFLGGGGGSGGGGEGGGGTNSKVTEQKLSTDASVKKEETELQRKWIESSSLITARRGDDGLHCVCVCVCVMCVRLTKRLRLYTGTCLQDERR